MRDLPLTHFHVFPYSKRKNTTDAKMDNHIQHQVKKERVARLIRLGEAKLDAFSEDQVGRQSRVLFERRNKDGFFTGYTTNFVKVYVKSDLDLKNQIKTVKLDQFIDGKLYGSILNF